MTDYLQFVESKRHTVTSDGLAETPRLNPALFDFQHDLVQWALAQGRAAIFADCGLGKTPMQLEWAKQIHDETQKPVLILTPLAVSYQTAKEATKFGIDAAISRTGEINAPIVLTNYERLHYFNTDDFGGVVCDESSAIKAFDGTRRAEVTEFLRNHSYRLLCTATAAPNDYIELGTSSEALGIMGYMDMINRFFTNDNRTSAQRGWGKQSQWRFKGHAEEPFWKWVASWARALRKPSDLGYDDSRFHLPPLHNRQTVIEAVTPAEGTLFDMPALGMREERAEQRRTIQERCETAAGLIADADTGVSWCNLNDESRLLVEMIPGAAEVKGSDHPDKKEETLAAFSNGELSHLVTKPAIGAWGLNWQHCHRMTYFPTHSYEQFYQAVRRCWRFGQTSPVTVDIVTTQGGLNSLKNLERKANQADEMFTQLVSHMIDATQIDNAVHYNTPTEVPAWLS